MSLRGFLAATFVALAPLIALHAHVNAGGVAPGWAYSWNGYRVADLALSQVRASQASETRLSLSVDDLASETARLAYSKEPLATNAHFVLAMSDEDQREKLLVASRSLNKRERLTGLMLVQLAAQRGEINKLFPLLDQLSRTEPKLASQLVQILSQSLADPDAAELVKEALAPEPVWSGAFWRSVPSESEALDAYLRIRAELAPELDEQAYRNLLARLVNTGRYSEAFALYEGVSPKRSINDAALIAEYPPIDWQLSSSRDAQARLNGSGSFEIFVEQNAAGEVARRLVSLKDGTYSLESRLDLRQGTGDITANLECLSGGNSGNLTTSLIASDDWQFAAPSCDFAWLIIKGSAWDSSVPLEATLRHISLEGPR